MITVAVYSTDPARRHDLEQLVRAGPGIVLIGDGERTDALPGLFDEEGVDVIVADCGPLDGSVASLLAGHERPALIVLVGDIDEASALEALRAGVHAVLPGTANGAEIAAAVIAAARGLSVLPRQTLGRLLDLTSFGLARPIAERASGHPTLTPREVEVLVAMADGASNKAIARQLGVSFHTVKFHVAAILAKLDAESRTEAVAQAARLGLVML